MQIRIAGKGGQGIVLVSTILGRALAIYSGKQVVQSQSYGAEARRGHCRGDVIAEEKKIHELRVTKPEIMCMLSQEAMQAYSELLKACEILVVDSDEVKDVPPTRTRVYKIPTSQLQEETSLPTNMIILGVLSSLSIVSQEALERSIRDIVPKKFLSQDLTAMRKGYEYGKRYLVNEP